jgi:hypothetical protein
LRRLAVLRVSSARINAALQIPNTIATTVIPVIIFNSLVCFIVFFIVLNLIDVTILLKYIIVLDSEKFPKNQIRLLYNPNIIESLISMLTNSLKPKIFCLF